MIQLWRRSSDSLWCLVVVALLTASCSNGEDGAPGADGAPGSSISSHAETLTISVTSASGSNPLVVNFKALNEDGNGFSAIGDSDLRFNIAKLIPASNGNPSRWQNYIVRSNNGAVQGSQERNRSGYLWGTLKNHNDGSYSYTFATNIANVSCPLPCSDADGNALDLSYQPTLTHRIGVQQGNSALPMANAVYDFVPNGGAVSYRKEIVKTGKCNECHDKITAHGSRFEVRLCVTCHNPGSWIAGSSANTTVDFKVMIHKIHRGKDLPSGSAYAVGSHAFSDVVFPQDIRNCRKCHDGADPDTPQGDSWQIPSLAACGSCHDDIDFSKDGSGTPPVDPSGHPGGIVLDNSECLTCHDQSRLAGSVADSHIIPGKAERAYFQFNILTICGTAVGQNPKCNNGSSPQVTFSVTDPTVASGHQYGNTYNILNATTTDPEYKTSAPTSSVARLRIDFAWDTRDYTNDGGSGSRPARAVSIDLLTSAAVTHLGNGIFQFDGAAETPPLVIPDNGSVSTPIGSGAVALEGRGAAPVYDSVSMSYVYSARVAVNSPVQYFAVNDSKVKARRQVVDAVTRCDRCHDVLSAHGSSRNNNLQLCVLCHNPSNTDVNDRAKDASSGLPLATLANGKSEESIDFKRLIHGIHAASSANYDGSQAHGFRENGLLIGSKLDAGSGTIVAKHDYSNLRFPGVLSKCETCHLPDTYSLADRSNSGGADWELPALNGIFGSTVNSYPNAAIDGSDFASKLADQSDDEKYSPIASVCSSCHDTILSTQHMRLNGAIFGGNNSQQLFQLSNVETCPVCHGAGKLADVKLVHDQAFAAFLGEIIP